jgi:hypothetical protein
MSARESRTYARDPYCPPKPPGGRARVAFGTRVCTTALSHLSPSVFVTRTMKSCVRLLRKLGLFGIDVIQRAGRYAPGGP